MVDMVDGKSESESVIDENGNENDFHQEDSGSHGVILFMTFLVLMLVIAVGFFVVIRYVRHVKNSDIQRRIELMSGLKRELNIEQI